MKWPFRAIVVPGLLLALTACGASGTGATSSPTDQPAPTITSEESVQTTTAVTEAESAPVTPIMQTLGLSGEHFAAEGDPSAPITVIEFSDYG
jgi:hypothetical protein